MATYDIAPTDNHLKSSELYVGRTVCFANVSTNPNLVGVLVRSTDSTINGVWSATINNVKYIFDKNGNCLNTPSGENVSNYRLYGIKTNVDLDITDSSTITRGAGSNAVTTTLNSLIPKDQFAICAMEALIATMPNAISMDDATILLLATKSYKIAQAMLYIGTLARGADAQSSQSQAAVPVDAANLSDNTQKILYNINETLKAIKLQDANQHNDGIKIATVTPTLKVDNPDNDEFDISGGGGGIDAAALKAACENNLNWKTLSNRDLVSIVGFEMKDGYRVPAENSISKLMKLLEDQELVTNNNSAWYWLRKSQGLDITGIESFVNAYGQDIYEDGLKDYVRQDIATAIDSAMHELLSDNPGLSAQVSYINNNTWNDGQ